MSIRLGGPPRFLSPNRDRGQRLTVETPEGNREMWSGNILADDARLKLMVRSRQAFCHGVQLKGMGHSHCAQSLRTVTALGDVFECRAVMHRA